MGQDAEGQRRLIVDQFTRQAVPFRTMPAHSEEESFRLVSNASGLQPSDTILDVACGPGLTACRFAAIAAHVTGIDLTPAMVEQAQSLQREKGLQNLAWHIGDVTALPFPDASFSLVFTRYSFHHMLDPEVVLAEMFRVCRPGGRVVVVDVYTSSPEQAEAYDYVETLRDPSHVRALGLGELAELFREVGLRDLTTDFYKLEVALDEILASSFPDPGNADKIHKIFAADVGHDKLGVGAERKQGRIHFSFPIAVLVARK